MIAEICVRLDGLPLALELAAARIRVLPPQVLLARLAQRFQVLTGGSRTLPERQQTLRNTIQWSYDLLDDKEQRLFRRLSVFVGGGPFSAAEVVCGAGGDASAGMGGWVLDGVASLIDKSLLHQTEQEAEEPRFLMLQTVREYGLEMLTATGELETNRAVHAHYFLALAEQAQPELHGPKQTAWLGRLEQEHDNLRAVCRSKQLSTRWLGGSGCGGRADWKLRRVPGAVQPLVLCSSAYPCFLIAFHHHQLRLHHLIALALIRRGDRSMTLPLESFTIAPVRVRAPSEASATTEVIHN